MAKRSKRKRGGRRPGAGRPKGVVERKPRRRKPGLAAVDPLAEQRKLVVLCAADGMAVDQIAIVLRMEDLAALTEIFAYELKHAHVLKRALLLVDMNLASENGKIGATKALLERTERAQNEPEFPGLIPPPAPASVEPKKPDLGKKEQRLEEARTAGQGSEWGDLLDTPPIGSTLN